MTDKIFLSWLAGYLDADGCFSIGLREQRTRNPYVAIRSQIRIGQKYTSDTERVLRFIKRKLGIGTIYYSNRDKLQAIIYWQTTRHGDALNFAKLIYPYLHLKKRRVQLFIEVLELLANTYDPKKANHRVGGYKVRSVENMLRIVKIATSINRDRPGNRYLNYKGYDYWEPLIKKWYK